MSKQTPPAKAGANSSIPEDLLAIFGAPPIISGESADDYFDLLGRMGLAAGAADAIDWLLVEQACALAWSLRRMRAAREKLVERRMDHNIMVAAEKAWTKEVLKAAWDRLATDDGVLKEEKEEVLDLIAQHDDYRTTHDDRRMSLDELAARFGIEIRRDQVDRDSALASAVNSASVDFKSLDGLIEKAEGRFEKTLREIDRRHLHHAKLRAIVDIGDAEPAPAMRVVASN